MESILNIRIFILYKNVLYLKYFLGYFPLPQSILILHQIRPPFQHPDFLLCNTCSPGRMILPCNPRHSLNIIPKAVFNGYVYMRLSHAHTTFKITFFSAISQLYDSHNLRNLLTIYVFFLVNFFFNLYTVVPLYL